MGRLASHVFKGADQQTKPSSLAESLDQVPFFLADGCGRTRSDDGIPCPCVSPDLDHCVLQFLGLNLHQCAVRPYGIGTRFGVTLKRRSKGVRIEGMSVGRGPDGSIAEKGAMQILDNTPRRSRSERTVVDHS